MVFDPTKPFNDLPLLPPAGELETRAVLKACIGATRALAELKGCGDLIPNQDMLINAIPLQEAKYSSQIENIVTTNEKLFQAAIETEGSHDPQTKEVVRYRKALTTGAEMLRTRPLGTNMFCELCTIIKGYDVDVRKVPGTTLSNPDTGEVIYTPPQGETLLRDLLANLEAFIHGTKPADLDSLVRLAVIHYQFEAIHPFLDGNGRTGRIINILYLLEKGLLDIPVLYLSRYIIEHKAEYYQKLLGVTRDQKWVDWIVYMLKAIEETALWTTNRIRAIRDLFLETLDRLPGTMFPKELIELLFEQPYCKIHFIVNRGIAKRQTAAYYLNELEKLSILSSQKVGRERIFWNPALLNILMA